MENLHDGKILVVDDDAQMCESIRLLLYSYGYNITINTTLTDAIVSLRQKTFDSIILDLKLDNKCGFDLIDHLKKNQIDTPVIAITGQKSEKKVIKAFKKGVIDYLKKPYEPDDLIAAVKNALESQRKERERNRIGSAIVSSRDRYRNVIDSQKNYLCRLNLNFDVTFINKSYADNLGLDPRQTIGRNYIALINESIQRLVLNQLVAVKTSSEAAVTEYKIPDPKGKFRYQQWHYEAIREDSGELLEIQCVGSDVTFSKVQAEKIEAAKEKYRQLAEITTDFIWEVDKDGYYTYVSPVVYDFLGYWPEEVIGKSPFDLMPEDEAKRLEMVFQTAFHEGRLLKSVENVNIHKDGSLVTLETNGVPIYDESGETIGYRGVDRNITDRKLAEKKLKDALNKVKILSGMLPICASCKKIRDDKGYWKQLELYISEHSEAEFSHSICPECTKKLYPEIYGVEEEKSEK